MIKYLKQGKQAEEKAIDNQKVKGIVENISESNADEHIHSLSKKYLNQDKYPISNQETRVIVSIKPMTFYVMK